MEERVQPFKVTDTETGNTYELDFTRDSVRFAEQRGFKVTEVSDFPATKIPELWYYAFRAHHRKLARSQTDDILDKLGGVTPTILERMILLYMQAMTSNAIQDDEDIAKNVRVKVEL